MQKEDERKAYNVGQLERNILEVFKSGDIGKLSEATYKFITLHMGFIAHYDLRGFMGVYADLGRLREKLQTAEHSLNPDYNLEWADKYENDRDFINWYGRAYCKSVAEGMKRIVQAARNYQPPLPEPPKPVELAPAQIHVVVGVYAGIVDHVSAWTNKARAEAERVRLHADYGIIPTLEGESAHTAVVYEIPLRTDE